MGKAGSPGNKYNKLHMFVLHMLCPLKTTPFLSTPFLFPIKYFKSTSNKLLIGLCLYFNVIITVRGACEQHLETAIAPFTPTHSPSMTSWPPSTSTSVTKRPWVESYLSRYAMYSGFITGSFTATICRHQRFSQVLAMHTIDPE